MVREMTGDYIELNGEEIYVSARVFTSLDLAELQDWACDNCKCEIYVRFTRAIDVVSWHKEGSFNESAKLAHLHHKNKNNKDNRIENLVLLCPNCHQLLHRHWNNPQLKLRNATEK